MITGVNSRCPGLSSRANGFTLVEMLVAISTLALMVVIIAHIVSAATLVSGSARNQANSEAQVRNIFDRMEVDIAAMPKNSRLDYLIPNDGAINSTMCFYSQGPGYAASAASSPSSLSLVGYRVNTASYQLEHLAYPLAWDQVIFLTLNSATMGNFAPLPQSVLAYGTPPLSEAMKDSANFHPIGPGVFRMEVFYFLTDGSFSTKPVATPSSFVNNLSASGAPSSTSDLSQGYAAGSRWYDTVTGRGYICQSAATGQAKWVPIGWQDVNAIVVTLAVLDDTNRAFAKSGGMDMSKVANAFTKATDTPASLRANPPVLPAQNWTALVNSGALSASGSCLLPARAAGAIRIYQHYFYLRNLNIQ